MADRMRSKMGRPKPSKSTLVLLDKLNERTLAECPACGGAPNGCEDCDGAGVVPDVQMQAALAAADSAQFAIARGYQETF